jgi:hypothetical protein
MSKDVILTAFRLTKMSVSHRAEYLNNIKHCTACYHTEFA